MTSQFSELVEDFSEPVVVDDDSAEDDSEGDPLTVCKLKDNLVRFTNATKPVSSLADSFVSLLRWNSPGATLLAFFVYMNTVYHGWLLSLILILFISQLILNYIT
nr:GRAM domain-containing protein 4-like [Parasteatoda tepidariorum]